MEKITLKNSEIQQRFASQLSSGRVFLVDVKDTKNPDVKQLEFAQQADLGSNQGSDADILQTLMGWSTGTILRTWQNASMQVLEGISLTPGAFAEDVLAQTGLAGPFSLQVTEYTEETDPLKYNQNVIAPIHEGRAGAKAKVNPSTDEVITYQGKPVYRHVALVRTANLKNTLLRDSQPVAARTIESAIAGEA